MLKGKIYLAEYSSVTNTSTYQTYTDMCPKNYGDSNSIYSFEIHCENTIYWIKIAEKLL